tara:strand:+ start:1680 stop:4568 length:2889 start_codon:yes stop_codon:yes gene_type:complete
MDNGRTVLTLNDIQGSKTLQEWGAKPGDHIEGDSLVRNYSEDQERQDLGIRLTEEDVANSPNLQSIEAEPGDRVVNGELVKDRSSSSWEQFKYHYDKTGGLTGYLMDTATIYTGIDFNALGETAPMESSKKYGENWDTATSEERREMLWRYKERQLQEEYGPSFVPQAGGAATAGSIVGELVDPTTLIPLPAFGAFKLANIAKAAGAGGIIGGTYSVAEDLSKTGKVDPLKLAGYTVMGGAIPGAIGAIGSKVAKIGAGKVINRVQRVVDEEFAERPSLTSLSAEDLPRIAEKAGLTEDTVLNAFKRVKVKGKYLNAQELADQYWKRNSNVKAVVEDSALSRLYSKNLDRYLGSMSTRIKNISEEAFIRLRWYEHKIQADTMKYMDGIRPFAQGLSQVQGHAKNQISRHLFNGDFEVAESLMAREAPELVENFKGVKEILAELHDGLKNTHDFKDVMNYFPRVVKDRDALLEDIYGAGHKEGNMIEKAHKHYYETVLKKKRQLTDAEKTDIANKVLRGHGPSLDEPLPRFVLDRTMTKIKENHVQFYDAPEAALEKYIRGAVNSIERRKFFGKGKFSGKQKDYAVMSREKDDLDLSSSIGSFVEDQNLTQTQLSELKELLEARFIYGEKPMGRIMSKIRDVGYAYTIANPGSALVQLGDVATVSALKGSLNGLTSLVLPKKIKMTDVVADRIGAEFDNPSVYAKALEKLFKYSGFKRADRLGKETLLNASFKQHQRWALKNPQKIKDKWGKIFGKETDSIIEDLKAGNVTENVKFMMFNELADIQPIALSEMPEMYLRHPNGRIWYMLKSFTLKQYDIVRNKIIGEYKKGNTMEATMNAARLASYLTLANLGVRETKNILSGTPTSPEDLPEEAVWSLMGVYGLNKYTYQKHLVSQDISELVASQIPPLGLAEGALKTVAKVAEDPDENKGRLLKAVPIFGKILYHWFGGGLEKAQEYKDRQ